MTPGQVRNILALLRSLDMHEIAQAGFPMIERVWPEFSDDPYAFFLRAPDAAQEAITRAMNRRLLENV